MKFVLLLFLLAPLSLKAQLQYGLVVKTRPLMDYFAVSPNLQVEVPIVPRFSVEAEVVWRRMIHDNSGFEVRYGTFHKGSGVTLGVMPRFYLMQGKNEEFLPKGPYLETLFRYNSTLIKNFEIADEAPERAVIDKYSKGTELGFVAGYQSLILKRIVVDLKIGAGSKWDYYTGYLLSGEPPRGYVNGRGEWYYSDVKPYLFLQLGYFFHGNTQDKLNSRSE